MDLNRCFKLVEDLLDTRERRPWHKRAGEEILFLPFDPHLAKWLHRITGPVHIVWGDTDRMFPIAYAHEFRRLLPHSRLTVLSRCGHMPHLERPRELADSIATGLAERPQ